MNGMMDSWWSFHISPNEDWFIDLKHLDNDRVLLGDNKAYKIKDCKVIGIWCEYLLSIY